MMHLCFLLVIGDFFLPHTAVWPDRSLLVNILNWESQTYLCKGISSYISPWVAPGPRWALECKDLAIGPISASMTNLQPLGLLHLQLTIWLFWLSNSSLFLAPLLSCQLSCVFKQFFVIIHLSFLNICIGRCSALPHLSSYLLLHHKPPQNLVAKNEIVYHFSWFYRLGLSWAVYLLLSGIHWGQNIQNGLSFQTLSSWDLPQSIVELELLTGWLDSKIKRSENVKLEVTKPLKVYLTNCHTWSAMFL